MWRARSHNHTLYLRLPKSSKYSFKEKERFAVNFVNLDKVQLDKESRVFMVGAICTIQGFP